jgi:hypothetical protein
MLWRVPEMVQACVTYQQMDADGRGVARGDLARVVRCELDKAESGETVQEAAKLVDVDAAKQ